MSAPGEEAFEATGCEFDPDAVLWVRGVDYVGGWRDARDAAAELNGVLVTAGPDTADLVSSAQTRADGSGVVRLLWPTETVRAVADLVRSAGELRQTG
ncbi:hypothetical protein [Streptomyces hesseae]|uniref:Uncharacterized protein n=1 Tax=Streptomyces hesseae TaxID=3075519 RepID=A0ABU2SV50_9ACTN|nr:hypothetical protein [Streptomyces sp. DSM 40473]MDT0452506.1 hypothetical protein [Streptomyces sp. DSM 40473]